MQDPQFSGQTKERLSSRECAAFVSGAVKDSFSLWLSQNTDAGDQIAERAILAAQQRARVARIVVRKRITSGPVLPGKLTCRAGRNVLQLPRDYHYRKVFLEAARRIEKLRLPS